MAGGGNASTLLAWNASRGGRSASSVAELFSSDFTLMAAAFVGLALTSVGILHDLRPFRLRQDPTSAVEAQGVAL
jgi:hypothetical protein